MGVDFGEKVVNANGQQFSLLNFLWSLVQVEEPACLACLLFSYSVSDEWGSSREVGQERGL